MSREFWAVIGVIAGAYLGLFAGQAVARLRFDCCYGETGYPTFGAISGMVIGAGLAWEIAGRVASRKQ